MNNLLQNTFSCNLMVWETDPSKRNNNNDVKFIVPSDQDIKKGDLLIGTYTFHDVSNYEITEIINRRPSKLSKKDYVTVKTKWTNKKPDFSKYNLKTNRSFNKLFNLE